MPRLILLTVLVAAFAAGTVSGTERAAADATQPSVYSDPIGDAGSAPDISTVTLTPGTGTVRFDITFTGALGSDGQMLLLLDADRNASTGSQGIDYAIELDGDGYIYAKWDGTQWAPFQHADAAATISDTHIGLTVTLADIGGVASFDWGIVSSRGNDRDDVPDGDGLSTYPAAIVPATVKAVILPGAILTARAGKVFRIPRLHVSLSDSTVSVVDSQTCTLSWKGKRLTPLAGGCAWTIPKAAKGRRLALKITYVYGTETHVVAFTVTPH